MRFTPTSLQTLSHCGERYRLRYVEKITVPPTPRMIVGRVVDDLIGIDLEAKVKGSETNAPMAKLSDVSSRVRRIVAMEDIRLTDAEASHGLNRTLTSIDVSAHAMASLHRTYVAPRLKPTAVQRPFQIEIADCQVTGQIDIQESGRSVRDTKVRTRAPAKDEADRSLQLTIYAMAVAALDGAIPQKLCLDVLVDSSERRPVTLESTRQRDQFAAVEVRVIAAARAVEAGNFIPCEPDNWRCSASYCEYFGTCRYT